MQPVRPKVGHNERHTLAMGPARLRIAIVVILTVLVVLYGLISFYMARGVTTSERNPQEDHPRNYGLPVEDVEFLLGTETCG